MENSTESKATPELTLTLTPELDDAPAPVLSAKPVEELAKSEGDLALDDSMLSDDEKKMVESFSEQINARLGRHHAVRRRRAEEDGRFLRVGARTGAHERFG